MSQFMDESTREDVRAALASMYSPVKLVYFTQDPAFGYCSEQAELLRDVAALSSNLSLEVVDWQKNSEKAAAFKIDKVPATVVMGQKDSGLRFFGLTAGYEFGSLVQAILMVAGGNSGLTPELEKLVQIIDVPVRIEVLVTLNCPYCPGMVHTAQQIAMANSNVRAEMVEAGEFQIIGRNYDVKGVPKTVLNGDPRKSFSGALPVRETVIEILKQVKPDEYERIDTAAREKSGQRHVVALDRAQVYDVLIVGAGPAAFTAAVYASRKSLKVAIVGEHLGGQVTNTAVIENWPGVPSVGGQDLAVMFRNHAERYAIAQQLKTRVTEINIEDGIFGSVTDSGAIFRSRSVIFAAGKEYRRLGVEGEDRFMGRGIAFCATCDAPLFKDEKVAVVGGANSAFTAVRDLLPYAAEVHLLYRGAKFKADPELVAEASRSAKVHLHTGVNVAAFLGDVRLSGLRLADDKGQDSGQLEVDGVFLEIGLEPNSAAVANLLNLNVAGEIPVGRDQSTELPGFFAAGDVTDEPDKQVVIAAAAGAKAALSAYRYLAANHLVQVSNAEY